MKARLIYHDKIIYSNGSIMEIVLWELPKKSIERPHGIKYRLYYGDARGHCLVRYDNEHGKGDHKHIGKQEQPYKFSTVETLIADFMDDVNQYKKPEENLS